MPARRINPFKPIIENQPNYPRMSTAEIRQNVQRMRNKANSSIERMQQSGYYSSALENREKKLRKEEKLHYKDEYFRSRGYDLKFRAGERFKDPKLERARLVKESKELVNFLNMATRTVSGIKGALNKMQEHSIFKALSEGMTPKEMSFKFSSLFDMADDIKKQYEEHGIMPSSFDKYEEIEALLDSIIPAEDQVLMTDGEKVSMTKDILSSMSQAQKDQLINSYVQHIKETHYAAVNQRFADLDAKLEALERKYRGF